MASGKSVDRNRPHDRLIEFGQHVLALQGHDVPASPVPDLTHGEQLEIRDALPDFAKPEFNRATAQDLGGFERAEPLVGIVDVDAERCAPELARKDAYLPLDRCRT